jgi:hypothetical protein
MAKPNVRAREAARNVDVNIRDSITTRVMPTRSRRGGSRQGR